MDILTVIERLRGYIEQEGYSGYDPYDALNSPILRSLTCNRRLLRILAIQAMKRMPFNLRPLLGIKKGINPKALGLFLAGYARLYHMKAKPEYAEKISRLLDLLEKMKSKNCTGNGWGYDFDWQSRAFFLPKFTPTIVNSSFIGHALIDAYRYTGDPRALSMALPIVDFIMRDLNRIEEKDALCFSYTPLDRYFVHNANLLGASLLIRIHAFRNEKDILDAALKGLAYGMGHQRPDGSWFYAEREGSRWIDSFHTGFNLQAIRYFFTEGFASEYLTAYARGVDFYARSFFLEDGTPKYFHDRVYPIDIHSAAQAIVFFSAMREPYRELTQKILAWSISRMFDKRGYFYFQKHRFHLNRIPYMRWSQAWMFHALTSAWTDKE